MSVLTCVFIYEYFAYPGFIFAIYAAWLLWDWKTPSEGGRSPCFCFLRHSSLFDFIRGYYPISLVKTSELQHDRKYIFVYFPHGMIPEAAMVALGSNAAGMSRLFLGINTRIAVHSLIFMAPVFREIALAAGFISVARESCRYALSNGNPGQSVVICVGGSTEVLYTASNTDYHLVLADRKGFCQLALQSGASLVPVFGFGQNNLFHQPKNMLPPKGVSCVYKWIALIKKYSTLAFWDRQTMGIIPRRIPINVVVGKAIHVSRNSSPTTEDIDSLHSQFVAKLLDLYKSNRDLYGDSKHEIVIA
ncbi:predicted protein [Nematostella vectensis]|uniref:Acyltransferase n=1 Tax=Nematostella vectensis TaxID=45351 RepID=A7RRY3_NEMVE|nr:predicted protein [Nematostella vectensis]|eukprot:XP_001637970.1 predicted protein [Nematostella vectensis]